MLHFISGWFKVGLGWHVKGGGVNHSIHKDKEICLQCIKGLVLGIKGTSARDARGPVPCMQGDSFKSEPCEIMEVAMWLCASLLIGL
jgi:hypothetical protein